MKYSNISSYFKDRISSQKALSFRSKLFKLRNFEILQVISWTKSVRENFKVFPSNFLKLCNFELLQVIS